MQDEADLEASNVGGMRMARALLPRWWLRFWAPLAGSSIRVSESQTEAASDLYAAMLANHLGDVILTHWRRWLPSSGDHASSTYARFGAMLEAGIAVDAGDMTGAEVGASLA